MSIVFGGLAGLFMFGWIGAIREKSELVGG
jgi:hypothetical protein